ncbi:DHA2 family efflux MFS transporter permease subunit [Opitutus terrae]|uniref:Drug resistance transporter, EmrB/QacA subfamily n=1 Tax=Opitutus terrae (strain DSM 11246 / JCM 15787 / PB90-1) TaxID=452637 RepID=B1ZPQ1_OPITP|nr:DHA2 family efflux MFS transporter permease subunit [Opitutus terrae]ACB75504.1 drug resistance transporter, EmrB/QacA subfamily [Opitutus terrae PB90-1]
MTAAVPAPAATHRGAITVCVMLATIMQALDTTIANVALPYMQSSLSAAQDQINLVLTSYIVAAAIMMPATGWLSARLGRKNLFLLSVAGFTFASVLCGLAGSLGQMVLFRLLQGVFGATLVPLSQAVLLDEYPPAQHGSAMALWGVGVMVGPILGPTLGGWLTETYDWRWVFYINLPVGVLTFLGLSRYLHRTTPQRGLYFDGFGFLTLAVAIGALQMMLDRGEQLQWFDSPEIMAEAALSGLGLYLFVVHTLTARRPFLDLRLFRDRNFATGMIFIFVVGVILLATLALLTPFLQTLLNYPVMTAGMLLAPRGVGTMLAMIIVGRLVSRVDPRWLVALGLLLTAAALWQMSRFSLDVTATMLVWSGVVQGLGLGFLFVPLSTMTFATLPADLRTSGTALYSLSRNLGSSIGISVVIYLLGQFHSRAHANLAEFVQPFRDPMQHLPALLDPSTAAGQSLLERLVSQQAALLAYLSDFRFMLYVALAALPLVLLMRRPNHRASDEELAAAME